MGHQHFLILTYKKIMHKFWKIYITTCNFKPVRKLINKQLPNMVMRNQVQQISLCIVIPCLSHKCQGNAHPFHHSTWLDLNLKKHRIHYSRTLLFKPPIFLIMGWSHSLGRIFLNLTIWDVKKQSYLCRCSHYQGGFKARFYST